MVATFSILRDLVSSVAGAGARAAALVGPGGDTHSYQSKLSDGALVAKAALLISNGLGFEEWLPAVLRAVQFGGRHVVASDGITPLMRRPSPGAPATIADPHCWHDVANARRYAANIAAGLQSVDSDDATTCGSRAKAFDERLAVLDGWVREQIATVPPAKRRVITNHDAFGYFARAYGVEFLSVEGINPQHDPAAGEMAELIALARRDKIRALFIENSGSTAFVRQLAQDTGGFVGEMLYPDSLSAPDGPAANYEALMRHNVSALVAGMLRN